MTGLRIGKKKLIPIACCVGNERTADIQTYEQGAHCWAPWQLKAVIKQPDKEGEVRFLSLSKLFLKYFFSLCMRSKGRII